MAQSITALSTMILRTVTLVAKNYDMECRLCLMSHFFVILCVVMLNVILLSAVVPSMEFNKCVYV
jgi:hypothetical protein